MATRIFLAVVGLLYCILAAWCFAQPEQTSSKVGLQPRPGTGQSEFMVIYVGLELALGILFLLPLLKPNLAEPMLLVCLILHACLALFRTISLFQFDGIDSFVYRLYAGELLIFFGSLLVGWLYLKTG